MSVIQFLFNPQDLFDIITQGSIWIFLIWGTLTMMFQKTQKSR